MAVVPPPPIVCRCSVRSRSFVLARKERGLRALHLDHACAPEKDWQRWRNRSRMSNLGDHRISGKTESPSNSGCFSPFIWTEPADDILTKNQP
jgi:hypothetical protein